MFQCYRMIPQTDPLESLQSDSIAKGSLYLHNTKAAKILHRSPRLLLTTFGVLTLGISLFLILHVSIRPTSRQGGLDEIQYCGNSSSEAQALGCQFDILSFGWVPKECFDRDTAVEFHEWLLDPARKISFPFYTSQSDGEWLPNEDILSRRAGVLWMTQEEHLGHCLFFMKRLHRLMSRQGKVDSETVNFHHTTHCVNFVMDAFGPKFVDLGEIVTTDSISFLSC